MLCSSGHCNRKTTPPFKTCDRCRRLWRESMNAIRAERRVAGRCPTCGGKADDGFVKCERCRRKHRILKAAHDKRKKVWK